MLKIALTGKMRAGKSTVADHLTVYYGFAQFAFGDALKSFAHEIFGKPKEKDRNLYQWFGQTMRSRDPDVWVRHLDNSIREYIDFVNENDGPFYVKRYRDSLPKNIVITDLRQPNEYDYCRREGYTIIRVNCPEEIRIERMIAAGDRFDQTMLDHETERYVDKFDVDYEIDNSGRWIDMAEQVDVIMRELRRTGLHAL